MTLPDLIASLRSGATKWASLGHDERLAILDAAAARWEDVRAERDEASTRAQIAEARCGAWEESYRATRAERDAAVERMRELADEAANLRADLASLTADAARVVRVAQEMRAALGFDLGDAIAALRDNGRPGWWKTASDRVKAKLATCGDCDHVRLTDQGRLCSPWCNADVIKHREVETGSPPPTWCPGFQRASAEPLTLESLAERVDHIALHGCGKCRGAK